MSAHVKAQILRFLRVSGYAFVVQLLATGGHAGWSSLWSLAAGAAETGLRQLLPVRSIPAVTAVLASAVPGFLAGVVADSTVKTHPGMGEPPSQVPLQPDGTGVVSNPASTSATDPAPPVKG